MNQSYRVTVSAHTFSRISEDGLAGIVNPDGTASVEVNDASIKSLQALSQDPEVAKTLKAIYEWRAWIQLSEGLGGSHS